MAHKPSDTVPVTLGKALGASAQVVTTLVTGTVLARVYTQPATAPDRALAFNPNSTGRASPVADTAGKLEPALYDPVNISLSD